MGFPHAAQRRRKGTLVFKYMYPSDKMALLIGCVIAILVVIAIAL